MSRAEWQSAWQGIRSRGWSAAFVIGLLGVALAANAVMFSVADSLVFRRDPFPHAERIFILQGQTQPPERIDLAKSAVVLQRWRDQPDLVSAAGGSIQKTVFLRGGGSMEEIATLDVTVGFLDVFGGRPQWGRGFGDGDVRDPSAFAVILSEDLARRRFGSPERALGQTLDASAGKHVVVGVMNRAFIYPNIKYEMWRALDPTGPLTEGFGGVSPIIRVSSEIPLERIERQIRERAPRIGAAAGLSSYSARLRTTAGSVTTERRTFVFVLVGAALCLLLAACASAASVALAGSARRVRTSAIHLALGASRARLARIAAIEGAQLVGAALILSLGLTSLGIGAIGAALPDTLRRSTTNPIDLDARVVIVMFALAAITWLAASLAPILSTFRSNLITLLKNDDRGAVSSRATAFWRRSLTASQVALAVALVICAGLFARTYGNLLAVDKGFDSSNLFSVAWSMPADYPLSMLRTKALDVLQKTTGVEAVTTSAPPPSTGDSPSPRRVEVDGAAPLDPPVLVGRKWVDANYFNVVRMPLLAGRLPQPGDAPTDVVIPSLFARRFFGSADPVGRSFRTSEKEPWQRVIGVVGDFRISRTRLPQDGDPELYFYVMSADTLARPGAPAPAAASQPRRVDTGGSWRFLSLTLRTNGQVPASSLQMIAQQIDPQVPATVSDVDKRYAAQTDDTRLAASVVSIFGWLAFIIAMAGVYGVMTFIVASRTREIGIRVALGADTIAIRRFVLGSSLRMVLLGGVAGIGLALLISRWLQSQLFGVSAVDPATYSAAAVVAVVGSALATWLPARHAASVDPAITLRRD
jgi:putative ABC transport system permease protein